MTTKLEQAARRLKDLLVRPVDTIAEMYCYYMGDIDDALKGLREALDHSGESTDMARPLVHACSEHPDAPHGFDRNASHIFGRYVCECEGWTPEDIK